jgi:ComEC/Rec2-related protein
MKKVFKIIIYIVIILLFLQKIHRVETDVKTKKIRSNILISSVPSSCELENRNYIFVLPDCSRYMPGQALEVAGYVNAGFSSDGSMFDTAFFNKKRLIIESINPINNMVVSPDLWLKYLFFVFNDRKRSMLDDLLPLFDLQTGYLTGKLGFDFSQVRSREVSHLFKITGTQYLASISGFHLNIVVRFFRNIFSGFLKNKFLNLISLLVSSFYLLSIGPKIPLVRAFLMLLFSIISTKFLLRQNNSIHSLFIVGLLLIYNDISAINSISFQLSFVATASIIFFTKNFKSNSLANLHTSNFVFNKKTIKKGYMSGFLSKIGNYIIDSAKISIYVQLAVTPLVLYYFNEFSIISLFVSIALTWLLPGIIISSFLLFSLKILEVKEVLMRILILPLSFLSKLFLSILKIFDNEIFLIKVEKFSLCYVLIWWFALLLIFKLKNRKKKLFRGLDFI